MLSYARVKRQRAARPRRRRAAGRARLTRARPSRPRAAISRAQCAFTMLLERSTASDDQQAQRRKAIASRSSHSFSPYLSTAELRGWRSRFPCLLRTTAYVPVMFCCQALFEGLICDARSPLSAPPSHMQGHHTGARSSATAGSRPCRGITGRRNDYGVHRRHACSNCSRPERISATRPTAGTRR